MKPIVHLCSYTGDERCGTCGGTTPNARADGWYVARRTHDYDLGIEYHCPFCVDALVAIGKAVIYKVPR